MILIRRICSIARGIGRMIRDAVLRPKLEGDLVEDFFEVASSREPEKCATGFFSQVVRSVPELPPFEME